MKRMGRKNCRNKTAELRYERGRICCISDRFAVPKFGLGM